MSGKCFPRLDNLRIFGLYFNILFPTNCEHKITKMCNMFLCLIPVIHDNFEGLGMSDNSGSSFVLSFDALVVSVGSSKCECFQEVGKY